MFGVNIKRQCGHEEHVQISVDPTKPLKVAIEQQVKELELDVCSDCAAHLEPSAHIIKRPEIKRGKMFLWIIILSFLIPIILSIMEGLKGK